MSHYADIVSSFKRASKETRLTETECVTLFLEVIGALEWDLEGVDYEAEYWDLNEILVAQDILFPNETNTGELK